MSGEEAAFVDRLGLFFEMLGGPRTMGRIYGWLLICEPPQQSLTALAGTLGVSKASVSTVIRLMQEGGLVERLPGSTRQHHYRITPGGFTQVLEAQLARMRAGVEAGEYGLSVVGEDRHEQRERLTDLRDFCEFCSSDAFREFIRRWEDYRKGVRR